MHYLIALLLTLILLSPVHAQTYPAVPPVKEPPLFAKQLRNTAALLSSKQSYVRILVYGQSISAQDWWLDVKSYFENKYPDATFDFVNRAIGGFSSDRLKITAANDIASFYPDLILFHDYGNEDDYEKIIRIIQSTTTADIAIQTDHLAMQNQEWHDRHSNEWLPKLCEKYGLALIDVRKYWKAYLAKNNLKIKDLLTDGVHLNHHGNYLMAGIIKSYLNNLSYQGLYDSRLKKLKRGRDFTIINGTINVTFAGNRIDIRTDGVADPGFVNIKIDQHSPMRDKQCYYYTRPVLQPSGKFLTRIGFPLAMELSDEIQEEEWTLKILAVDSVNQQLSFSLSGSATGDDGSGKSSEQFSSASGKISIHPDWWFRRRNEGDFSQFYWLHAGEIIQWQTKSSCSDKVILPHSRFSPVTIFQGISNAVHQLQLSGSGVEHIDEIMVYKPILKE